VVASELITLVLMEALIGEFLVQGMWIALICSGPISAWIAIREMRMRQLIAFQRDRLSVLNSELQARNSDLDAFARAVAHDLKNPLTAVVGLADVLVSTADRGLDEETSDLLQLIAQSGDRAVEIIDGLLLLHGIQHDSQDLGTVDTDVVVAAALETLAGRIADTDAVVTQAGAFPSVWGHGPWLLQVWANLIGNAIKYGGVPPAVDLSARAASDGMIRFEIQDNGDGIPADDKLRIFGEFQRGDRADVEGHGLGLAIVDRIVRRLGGERGVDVADNGGSVFWFTVPAA
jgi:signal transduction histidine kinase